MNLATGITGFRHYTDPELPTTDERAFFMHCHAVAHALHGDVQYVEPVAKLREKNFSIVTVRIPNHQTSVILNAHYPYLAFASGLSRGNNSISFIDWTAGATEFKRLSYYTTLTTEELGQPLSQIDTSPLADAELEQIKYWRPQTVGELVFNFWD